MKRKRVTVAYLKAKRLWQVSEPGNGGLFFGGNQREAIYWAATRCRQALRERGQLSELIIKGRDGRIRDTRTYGRDPRRIRG